MEVRPPPVAWPSSPSSASWISVTAFHIRNRPPAIRIRSRTENPWSPMVNSGSLRPTIQEIVSSRRIRIPIARPRPIVRARSRCSAGQPLHEHRDEHDVVDAQHDLEDRQGQQGDPRLGVGEPVHAPRVASGAARGARGPGRHYHLGVMPTRSLPVLEHRAAGARPPTGPRAPVAPDDERLDQFRPEPRSLPAVLRLDAGLPDEQERLGGDGGAPARGRLRGGALDGGGRPRRHQHLRDPRGGRGQGHRPPGPPAPAQGGEPRAAGRDDRLLRPRVEPGRPRRGATRPWTCSCGPTRSRSWSTGSGLASAQAPVGALASTRGDHHRPGRRACRTPTHLVRARADAIAGGAVVRGTRAITRLAADHLRLRQDVHLLHRPVQPRARSGAARSTRSSTRRAALAPPGYREVTLLGQNVNSLRPRPRARGALRARRTRRAPSAGARTARVARTSPSSSAAIDGLRTADGAPAIPRLRFVTSHPWDLSDRLIEAMRDCPSVCEALHLPVQSGADSMLRRMGRQYTIEHYLERLGADPRGGPGDRALDRRHRRVLRRDRRRVRGDAPAARDRPLRPGLRGRLQRAARDAGHAPRRRRPGRREAPPARRAAGPPGGRSGSSATGRGSAATTEVLVDTIVPPRAARPRRRGPTGARSRATRSPDLPEGVVHLAGRSRENKLVHLAGPPTSSGASSDVRVEHAGPYALRGTLA